MEKYSVDRIENDIAVCENEKGVFINIDIKELPSNVREGLILIKTDNNTYVVDEKETLKRKKYLFDLQNELN